MYIANYEVRDNQKKYGPSGNSFGDPCVVAWRVMACRGLAWRVVACLSCSDYHHKNDDHNHRKAILPVAYFNPGGLFSVLPDKPAHVDSKRLGNSAHLCPG